MKKDQIFSLIVLGISLLNIYNNNFNILVLSVLLSVIGILGAVSYFLKLKFFKHLILIWIIGQIPNIEFIETINDTKSLIGIFNLNQFFDFRLGLTLGFLPINFIGINIFPLIYIGFYKFLINSSLIGKFATIIPVREISPLSEFSPLKIEIIDTGNKNQLVGKIDPPISINDIVFNKLFFKTSDKSLFKINKEKQMCDIKLKNSGKIIETNGYVK